MYNRHLVKIVGLGLLAAVGAVVISTDEAQAANYQLLRNGVTVNSLLLSGTVLLGQLLWSWGTGITFHCAGGVVHAHLETVNGGAKLNGSAHTTYEGCTVKGLETRCMISSTYGAGDLKILVEVMSAAIGMEGEDTSIAATGPFAKLNVEDLGSCPFDISEVLVQGSLVLSVLKSETGLATHLVDTEGMLEFGGFSAEPDEGLAHVQEYSGASWSIDLA